MLNECMDLLGPKPGDVFVDCTLGLGGHAEAAAKLIGPTGLLIGFDWDRKMLELAEQRLEGIDAPRKFINRDFRSLKTSLEEIEIPLVDCILIDLGLSSVHLDLPERGMSFRFDAPLDMRMDQAKPETAADLLNRLPQAGIERILRVYGEERFARSISRRIVEMRQIGKMLTTWDLVEAVRTAIPAAARNGRINPATRSFQAIRIAVNSEIEGLDEAIQDAVSALKIGGRIAVLSYHSGEDREVKHAFQRLDGRCICPHDLPECRCGAAKTIKILSKKPFEPTKEEVMANPRARSAKLRAVERIA
jgi:16S rRNA (cytosine1402-N4)-methyltransferase